jgi:hypothetical protein
VTDSLSRHALDILWFRPYPTAFFINSNSLVRKVWDKMVDEEVRTFLFYKNNKKDLLLPLPTDDEELQKSKERDKFDVQQRQEVSVGELQPLLLRFEPGIVHFSGHGSEESALVFQNEQGNTEIAPPSPLTNLFQIINSDEKIIQCVVLNACYSERQAEAISKYVPCVVGMSNAISDEAAIKFAASFYRALGFGRSVNSSFLFGCNDIGLQNIPEEATPKLKYSPGVDPAKVYLTKT